MVLKTTFTDGQVIFEDLGDKFILTSKQRCHEKFDAMVQLHFYEDRSKSKDDLAKDCYAFVSPLRIDRFDIPIYKGFYYSLLSERGCELMSVSIGGL